MKIENTMRRCHTYTGTQKNKKKRTNKVFKQKKQSKFNDLNDKKE